MKSKFKNIMIILILISFSLGQTGNDEYNLRKQAEIYYQQKKYDDALEIYLNIFNQNPTSYEYLRKLKNILTQKKEYSQLINCYNKFISSTTNKKLIFEAETDLIEFKIWNQESDWINDLYLMEQKYENEKNNIYKFEFILLKVSKNKKINEVYDFILHIRMKYKKPAFFSKKLISIFADQADYKRSINESILFITESEKTNKISAITKNLIVDQIFEYLNKILINNQIL